MYLHEALPLGRVGSPSQPLDQISIEGCRGKRHSEWEYDHTILLCFRDWFCGRLCKNKNLMSWLLDEEGRTKIQCTNFLATTIVAAKTPHSLLQRSGPPPLFHHICDLRAERFCLGRHFALYHLDTYMIIIHIHDWHWWIFIRLDHWGVSDCVVLV